MHKKFKNRTQKKSRSPEWNKSSKRKTTKLRSRPNTRIGPRTARTRISWRVRIYFAETAPGAQVCLQKYHHIIRRKYSDKGVIFFTSRAKKEIVRQVRLICQIKLLIDFKYGVGISIIIFISFSINFIFIQMWNWIC